MKEPHKAYKAKKANEQDFECLENGALIKRVAEKVWSDDSMKVNVARLMSAWNALTLNNPSDLDEKADAVQLVCSYVIDLKRAIYQERGQINRDAFDQINKVDKNDAAQVYNYFYENTNVFKKSGCDKLYRAFLVRAGKRGSGNKLSFDMVKLARVLLMLNATKTVRFNRNKSKVICPKKDNKLNLWDRMKNKRIAVYQEKSLEEQKECEKEYEVQFNQIWGGLNDLNNSTVKKLWLACGVGDTNFVVAANLELDKKDLDAANGRCRKRRINTMTTFFRWMNLHLDNVQLDFKDEYYNGKSATFFIECKREQAKSLYSKGL